MAKRWRDVVNRHGGDVTVVYLPEIGIRGNTRASQIDNLQLTKPAVWKPAAQS
jgi:hypothetical protein